MTDIEALGWFERRKTMCLSDNVQEAENFAISAIREQIQRKNGCEYCNSPYRRLTNDGDSELVQLTPLPAINLSTGEIDSNAEPPYWAIYMKAFDGECEEYIHVMYCPCCGRKLTIDDKENANV